MWRLVFDEHSSITFSEAASMDVDTLIEANEALNEHIKRKNAANKGGKK